MTSGPACADPATPGPGSVAGGPDTGPGPAGVGPAADWGPGCLYRGGRACLRPDAAPSTVRGPPVTVTGGRLGAAVVPARLDPSPAPGTGPVWST